MRKYTVVFGVSVDSDTSPNAVHLARRLIEQCQEEIMEAEVVVKY